LGLTIKSFLPPIIYDSLFVRKEGAGYFYGFGSNKTFGELDYLNTFLDVPEVSAVIGLKARTFSNMRLKCMDKNGNEINNPKIDKLRKIILAPNWFQAGKEFLIQTKTFREIYGNEYLYLLTPLGFNPDPERIKGVFTLPPNLVESKYTDSAPFYKLEKSEGVKYTIKQDGKDVDLETQNIIHLNDNRVSVSSSTDKKILQGESRLKALKPVINNIRQAYESRGIILKYRGANGAWVNKSKDASGMSLPMNATEKKNLQDKNLDYGTLVGQSQTIVTDQDLAWVQAGTNNPMNLGLFQEIEQGFNKILDSYSVPAEMFVRPQGSTYENQKQAEKGLYVRTIIPEANEWIMSWNSILFPDGNFNFIADYSHLAIFQEDWKYRGEALTQLTNALSKALQDGAITIDQYKNELSQFGLK
jgi:phage portal protein BeeE